MGDINTDYKIVRDPLYGYIGLTKRETELLDTVWLQRLRRIKQLAMTELVYPSAVHTRFEHSLGVLHVANAMALQLNLDDHDREVVRIAGLLHDTGHGPFSHVFESILEIANNGKIDHEKITLKILETDVVRSILEKKENIFNDVYSILAGQGGESIARDIIDSSLDADKLDYLRRDSYHTGVMYGVFDFDRIVKMLDSDSKRQHIAVKEKGIDALESFRLARYLMHKQVYRHHVRAITDSMLVRAARLHIQNSPSSPVNSLIFTNEDFLSIFCDYDDSAFLQEISGSLSEEACELVQRLRKRRLLKRCYEKDMKDIAYLARKRISKMGRVEFEELERSIAEAADLNPNLIIIYPVRIINPVYRNPDSYLEEGEILIKKNDGEIVSFNEQSSISGSQEKSVEKLYVFSLPEDKGRLQDIVENEINNLA